MTLKFIKLFFIGTFLIIGTNCENEEWIELNLTDNYCNEIVNEETGYINDHEGILISNDDSSPAFTIEADKYGDLLPGKKVLFPCNLPSRELLHEGQKIRFSGKLIKWEGTDSDSIVGDAFSIPIILTNAKVKN